MTRLFVAVWPSEQAREHIRSLPRDGWVNVRWLAEDNWHVTLAFVGEAEIDQVARRLEGDYPATTAEVAARMRVLGRNNLVVPVSGLDALAEAVHARVFDAPPDKPFRGHLTVGRAIGGRLGAHARRKDRKGGQGRKERKDRHRHDEVPRRVLPPHFAPPSGLRSMDVRFDGTVIATLNTTDAITVGADVVVGT